MTLTSLGFLILLIPALAEDRAAPCPAVERTVVSLAGFNRPANKVRTLDPRHITRSPLAPNEPNTVWFGVSPHGHAYVYFNGIRYDAAPFKRGEISLESVPSQRGILLGIPLTDERARFFRQYLESGRSQRVELSCIHGACRVLEQGAGLRVRQGEGVMPNASRLFENIIRSGFVDRKTGEVLRGQLWLQYGAGEVAEGFLDSARTGFARQQESWVRPIAYFATGAIGTGVILYVVAELLSHDSTQN